tara:strand:+ start:161 stop:295 length:135 start_codon:yes stop_codon:yes gene_type:complete
MQSQGLGRVNLSLTSCGEESLLSFPETGPACVGAAVGTGTGGVC